MARGVKKEPTYGDAAARLEEILAKIEEGEVDIDELSGLVEEAAELVSLCRGKIRAAEVKVKTITEQLERESQKFIHETRNVAVENGKIVLSEIFKWYAEDFKPDPVAWIRSQADDIELPEGAEVTHRKYDWSLNDQGRQGSKVAKSE